jgi:Arc/MetJ family transcription regulator
MQKYGNGQSDIVAFDIAPGSITLELAGGARYLYTSENVGAETVSAMSVLAKAGSGLSAFMASDLRGRYSSMSAAGSPTSKQTVPNAPTLTSVLVDSELIEKALGATKMRTSRDVVERGLRTLLQLQAEQELLKMQGTVEWEGDLDAMRADK